MADPNSCASCKHKRTDTGSGWCYMFREQPQPLCMQHQDRKRFLPHPKGNEVTHDKENGNG